MSEQDRPTAAPLVSSDKNEDKVAAQKEFDAKMAAERDAQGQGNNPNFVPEQRPIASQTVDDPHSRVYNELKKAGDPRANDEPMPKSAYDKAASSAQATKAAKESRGEVRLYPGARAFIDNEGSPDHGRAVAVNRVTSWKSDSDELLAAAGTTESRFSQPAEYECFSRDGRAELLIVSADHLRVPTESADWGRTSIS
jgi:hypothetical protein